MVDSVQLVTDASNLHFSIHGSGRLSRPYPLICVAKTATDFHLAPAGSLTRSWRCGLAALVT